MRLHARFLLQTITATSLFAAACADDDSGGSGGGSTQTSSSIVTATATSSATSQATTSGAGGSGGAEPAAPFVLVHGAWMGAWSWEPIAEELTAAGRQVVTVELPGHGQDSTPVDQLTLSLYVDAVKAAIADVGGDVPVTLVGHSMGGVVLAQTAEQIPEQIGELVFVAAYVPRNGESLLDWALMDGDSVLADPSALEQQGGGALLAVSDAFVIPAFCAECDAAAQALVTANLEPEATAPLATPVALTAAGFDSVPRRYVRTTSDAAVSPTLQDAMIAATPMDRVDDIASGHLPQLEATDALAAALLDP